MEVWKNTTMDDNNTLHHRNYHHDPSFFLPSDDDRRYLLAELTLQLARNSLRHNSNPPPPQKKEAIRYSTSPQSTLSGFGPYSGRTGYTSPNGPSRIPSPETDVAWELLYDAASEVAKLKMEAMAAQLNLHRQNRALNSSQYPPLKRQGYCQHPHHHHQSAWPSVRHVAHNHHHQHHSAVRGGSEMRSEYLGSGSGRTAIPPVKRQSTGTGVFIPQSQRVGSLPEPSRKKPTGCSTVLLPARVVQALNLDLKENNNGVHRNSKSHFPSGFLTDHVLRQEKASMKKVEGGATMAGGHEICLPTEWTY